MSGLGGHQQESWVLIHFMRKVEIGKEACKTKGGKKKKPSRNTVWKRRKEWWNWCGQILQCWEPDWEDTREQEEGTYNSGRTMRCPQATVFGGYRKWYNRDWAQESQVVWTPETKLPPGLSPLSKQTPHYSTVLIRTPEEKVSQLLQFQNGNFKASLTGLRIFFSPSPLQQRIQAWQSILVTCVFQTHFWDHLSAARSLTSET